MSFAQEEEEEDVELPTADPDLGSSREASRTDEEAVKRCAQFTCSGDHWDALIIHSRVVSHSTRIANI